MLSKTELRANLKQARLSLARDEHAAKSAAICERLKAALDWSQVNTLHCFEPITELGEVNVTGFSNSHSFYTSRKLDGVWQIVPVTGDGSVPKQFDVILVPMLGFDPKTLHRIGYGGGYYDKFLSIQSQAQKIGVCFELGKLDEIPIEPHDVPLNRIITEDKMYAPAYTVK